MYAILIEQHRRIHRTTSQEVAAILARDAAQRESQEDPDGFYGHAVVDAKKEEKEEAKKQGYTGPQSEWHVIFSYTDFLLDVWTTKSEGYRSRKYNRPSYPAFAEWAEFKFN